MSPRVASVATNCSGHRTGPPVEQPRIVSAQYNDGVWTVKVVGLWQCHPPARSVPRGEPTLAPWQLTESFTDCEMKINAETGDVESLQAVGIMTATPPAAPP
jgi:hypothetical protein